MSAPGFAAPGHVGCWGLLYYKYIVRNPKNNSGNYLSPDIMYLVYGLR